MQKWLSDKLKSYLTPNQLFLCQEAEKLIVKNQLEYHNMSHILYMLSCSNFFQDYKEVCPLLGDGQVILTMATFFHDVVYKIGHDDNEHNSAVMFRILYDKYCVNKEDKIPVNFVEKLICLTKYENLLGQPNNTYWFTSNTKENEQLTDLSRILNFYDWYIMADISGSYSVNFTNGDTYCENIMKEIGSHNKKGRINFLMNCLNDIDETKYNFKENEITIKLLNADNNTFANHKNQLFNNIARNIKKELLYHDINRIGLYSGSFDLPTIGHEWLINDAAKQVDLLIVMVATNSNKQYAYNLGQRISFMEKITQNNDNVIVLPLHGGTLLYNAIKPLMVNTVYRGIRNPSDYEYESQMLMVNRYINDKVHTVFIMPPREYSEISSSMVKSLIGYENNETLLEKYIPSCIVKDI